MKNRFGMWRPTRTKQNFIYNAAKREDRNYDIESLYIKQIGWDHITWGRAAK